MAKIYGTPIMAGGAGGANKDLPPLLDNFKASVPVEGIRVDELELKTKIKLGKYDSLNLQWLIADKSNGIITLLLDGVSSNNLGNFIYDNAEPENPVSNRKRDGNNRYIYSNLHQWINSDKPANEWYTAQHTYDVPPDYQNKNGFLYEWNDVEKSTVNTSEWTTSKDKLDGEGDDSFSSKLSIMSIYELGFSQSASNPSLQIFQSNADRATGAYYWTRTPDSSYPSSVNVVTNTGAKGRYGAKQNTVKVRPICKISADVLVSPEPDSDGCYTLAELAPVTLAESDNYSITLSADKMEERRAEQLAGAVWVYGDHSPVNVNDGTKIQLTREECITSSLEGEDISVNHSIPWSKTKDFYARQFTYNSKKQYQTMLEGAIATLVVTGVPDSVTELAETHSGSSITLTWKNPTSDEFYDHTVVVYKTDAFPTAIDDGTQGYSGTDETATLSGLELGSTYYIAVFTVSAYGLYGEPQTVQVEIPAGQLLSSLASGTKVKLGKWNNTDLQWKVARDTSDQSIRLVLEPTSVSLLGNKMWDNKEPSNSNSNRRSYGNNRYIYSNIHQWLNATKATSWYTAQHSTDAEPDYSSQAGFLSGWSENHIAALDRATLTVSRSSTDGGGTETFVSRVALMSTTELGLESGTGNGRLDIFNSNGDRATGSVYWTRTPHPSSPNYVRPVSTTGELYTFNNAYYACGVRPLCSPKSTALVSLEMDGDNCYIVQ